MNLYFNRIDFTDPETFSPSAALVPRPVLLLYAAHFFVSEVHNGGFLQFFWNSTGLMAPESVLGFEAIGMPKLAALLVEVATPLGTPYPRDRNARWDALLIASGRTESDLKEIFERAPNLYVAFEEAIEPLSFKERNRQAWDLARTENGGFQEAATRFAQNLHPVQ